MEAYQRVLGSMLSRPESSFDSFGLGAASSFWLRLSAHRGSPISYSTENLFAVQELINQFFRKLLMQADATDKRPSAIENGKVFSTLASHAAHQVGLHTMHECFLGDGSGFRAWQLPLQGLYIHIFACFQIPVIGRSTQDRVLGDFLRG